MDDEAKAAYREAWEDWQRQLQRLHGVLLDGDPINPDQLKGLLNREARKKDVYDRARLRLLGLEEGAPVQAVESPDTNPFKRD